MLRSCASLTQDTTLQMLLAEPHLAALVGLRLVGDRDRPLRATGRAGLTAVRRLSFFASLASLLSSEP
eukprot:2898271-Pyramimonas_sp.AAC.1